MVLPPVEDVAQAVVGEEPLTDMVAVQFWKLGIRRVREEAASEMGPLGGSS